MWIKVHGINLATLEKGRQYRLNTDWVVTFSVNRFGGAAYRLKDNEEPTEIWENLEQIDAMLGVVAGHESE